MCVLRWFLLQIKNFYENRIFKQDVQLIIYFIVKTHSYSILRNGLKPIPIDFKLERVKTHSYSI